MRSPAARWAVATDGLRQIDAKRGKKAQGLPDAFYEVKEAINALEGLDFDRAKIILAPLIRSYPKVGLQRLSNDALAFTLLAEAQSQRAQHKYAEACDAYRNAEKLIAKLPYSNILRELLGDIEALARQMDTHKNEANKVSEQVKRVRKAFSKSETAGEDALRAALASRAQNPALGELIETQVTEFLHLTSYDTAMAIARIGMDYMPNRARIHDLHLIAQYLAKAYQAWRGWDRTTLREQIEVIQYIAGDTEDWLLIFFNGCFNEALAANDYHHTQLLLDVFPWMQQSPDMTERMYILIKAIREEWLEQFEHDRASGLRHLRENLERDPSDRYLPNIAQQIIKHYLLEQQFNLAGDIAECANQYDPRIAKYGVLTNKLREAQRQWEAGNVNMLRVILDETTRLEHEIADNS